MGAYDIRMARLSLPSEWERLTFDAFVLPVHDLGLTEDEKTAFVRNAKAAVDCIDWETYTTTRQTFLSRAEDLLRIRPLTASVMADVRRSMYVRFMEGRIRYFKYREHVEHCPLPPVPVGERDFHNTELASVFAHLPDQPEVASWLEQIRVSWTYDQLHMVTWFSGQLSLGSGKYSRSRPNHSAKTTYERLLNPFSLLWIAAALGEDKDLVIRTGHEINDYTSWRAKCGVVRRAIPWRRIYELALPLVEKERKGL